MDADAALDAAIRTGDIPALRRLAGDAWPDASDASGTSYLLLAIYHGPLALVQALLAAGADPNASVSDGFPSLFAAINRSAPDQLEVLAALLAAGADVQQRGVNDYTALHHAVCRDAPDIAQMLLAHGADPEARTRIDNYATPLEEAERFGNSLGAAALRAR